MSLAKLRNLLKTEELEAIIVSKPENRRYLSNFTGSAGILFITAKEQFILTDSRYYQQVKNQAPDWTLVEAGYNIFERLAKLAKDLNLHKANIGFEADHITVLQIYDLSDKLPEAMLVETANFVDNLRAVKTPAELTAIKKAIALADETMSHLYQTLQPGITELALAWELEAFMRTRGASALAFEVIAASGPNAALPHARPTDRVIGLGDVVLIDMGCVIDGYNSDITRTFSLGQPSDSQYLEVWEVVNQANIAAAQGIKAGIASNAADALARDIIAEAGYGDNFGHSLGHGVGLAVHEQPRVSYATEAPIPAGSVITIEPGIYLPGQFGVRIEDIALVTESGTEILTAAAKMAILPR